MSTAVQMWDVDPGQDPEAETHVGPVTWVMTKADLAFFWEAIRDAEVVVFDHETTGLFEYATTGGPVNGGIAARVPITSFTLPRPGQDEHDDATTWLLPLSHPESPWLGQWRRVLRATGQRILKAGHPLVAHNGKFDLRYTYGTTGCDLSTLPIWDTMVSSRLLDTTEGAKLKPTAARTFGIGRWDDFDLSYPGAAEEVPLFQLGDYAARDTYWTWRLWLAHRERMFLRGPEEPDDPEEIREARLGQVATHVAMPTLANMAAVEERGFMLDLDWVHEALDRETARAADLLAQMEARYRVEGTPSTAPTSKWFGDWTSAAVECGDLEVQSMTKTGKPQWSKAVLKRQAHAGSDTAQLVLDQRAASKLAEFLRSWLVCAAPDGAVHASYNIGRVSTGRLSCENPNIQQVTKALKPAFIPRPGHVLIDFDYSQVEMRVAAFVSRCEPMIAAFQRGDDLHRMLAAEITGLPPEQITTAQRKSAKAGNFGLLYGMAAGGFRSYAEAAYDVALTMDEAQSTVDAFYGLWEGVAEWHRRAIAKARREGYAVSPIGRIQELPDLYSDNPKMVSHAERNAINTPVQGFASDLMQMASASIQGRLNGWAGIPGVHIVATVHDSIVAEVEEDGWQDTRDRILERMTNVNPLLAPLGVTMDVPIAAEAEAGTRWGLGDLDEH